MPLVVSVVIATAVVLVSVTKGAGLNVLANRATALMTAAAAAGWEAWLSAVGSFRLSAGASPSATEPEPG